MSKNIETIDEVRFINYDDYFEILFPHNYKVFFENINNVYRVKSKKPPNYTIIDDGSIVFKINNKHMDGIIIDEEKPWNSNVDVYHSDDNTIENTNNMVDVLNYLSYSAVGKELFYKAANIIRR